MSVGFQIPGKTDNTKAKEILLYSPIYSYSAANFINELEANRENDICVRGNCPGGDVFAAIGMSAKYQEHKKEKSIHVDGVAASAFAYMVIEADPNEVECLDASTFLFHRASMGTVEEEKEMSAAQKKVLSDANTRYRARLEAKASSDKFKQISGTSYDEIFSMDGRKDVILNAQQAKELNIVGNIKPMTSQMKAEILVLSAEYKIAAFSEPVIIDKKTFMTAAEFKISNPAAYAEIENAGITKGISAEQARSKEWNVFREIDPVAVAKGLESGLEITRAEAFGFMQKGVGKGAVAQAETENPQPVIVAPVAGSDADKAAIEKANYIQTCKGMGMTDEKIEAAWKKKESKGSTVFAIS